MKFGQVRRTGKKRVSTYPTYPHGIPVRGRRVLERPRHIDTGLIPMICKECTFCYAASSKTTPCPECKSKKVVTLGSFKPGMALATPGRDREGNHEW